MRPRWIFALVIFAFGLAASTVQAGDCAAGFAALASSQSPAVRDFHTALQAGKFDSRTMFFSYEVGGGGDRILVRAEALDHKGSLYAFDESGRRIHLTLAEVATARVSSSENLIRHFESTERGRVVLALSDDGADDATREFRARWRQRNFETPHPLRAAGVGSPFVISYVRDGGERLAARAVEVMPDGHIKVRTGSGSEQILGTAEMKSARMASAGSAKSFLEGEATQITEVNAHAAAPRLISEPARVAVSVAAYRESLDKSAKLIDFALRGKPQAGSYHTAKGSPWRQWMEPTAQKSIIEQGWKVHVGAPPKDAARIAEALLPELRKRGIPHKVFENLEKYMELIRSGNVQAGKFITIYPRSDAEARDVAHVANTVLQKLGLGKNDFVNPPGELVVRPGVYARYGKFLQQRLTDAKGNEIPGTENAIRATDGSIIYDERGTHSKGLPPSPFN